MADCNEDDHSIDPTLDLFGEPALLKGEDKALYLKLRAAVAANLEPKTFADWTIVHDQTSKLWEEQRLKRATAALIDGAQPEALEILLRPFSAAMEFINESPSDIARNYFSGDPKDKKEAILSVTHNGITPAQIQAKAMEIRSGGLQMIERMGVNRENGRRMLRKEHELRRKERERQRAANDNAAARKSDSSRDAEA